MQLDLLPPILGRLEDPADPVQHSEPSAPSSGTTAGTAMSDAPQHPAAGSTHARNGLQSDSSHKGSSAHAHAAGSNLAAAERPADDSQRSQSSEQSIEHGLRLSSDTAPTGSLSDGVKVGNSDGDSPDESRTPRADASPPVRANWIPSTPSPAPTLGQTSRGTGHSNDMPGEPGCTL